MESEVKVDGMEGERLVNIVRWLVEGLEEDHAAMVTASIH